MLHEQDIITLRDFVTTQLGQGASETQLRGALMHDGGWSKEELDTLFSLIPKSPQTPPPAPTPIEPVAKTAPIAEISFKPPTTPFDAKPIPSTPSITPATPQVMNSAFIPENKNVAFAKKERSGSGKKILLTVILAVVILFILGGVGAWAYYQLAQKMAVAPYMQENLLSGLYAKSKEIQTLTSTLTASVVVEPRDADAKPFILPESTQTEEWRAAYERDVERVHEMGDILRTLLFTETETFPETLADIESAINEFSFQSSLSDSIYDPLSQTPYAYRTTNAGTDFELQVTFETDEAIKAFPLQNEVYTYSSSSESSTPLINEKTVTCTKNTSPYFYLPSEPPKPFIAQLHEQSRFLPAELSGSLSIKTTADMRASTNADGEFSIDASADFGDMSYVLGGDFRKVGSDIYARIRHLPGLLMMFLGQIPKDTWIHLTSPEDAEDEFGYGMFSVEELMDAGRERGYNSPELRLFAETIMRMADEEGLVRFRTVPQAERVDGASLYRYDLTIHKPALVPFLKRAYIEVQNNDALIPDNTFDDATLITYLESDAFEEIFTYLEQNISLILYVDKAGYPIKTEVGIRLVPPDTATQLAGKQVRITLLSENANINQPISITAPENAVPMKKIMEDMEKNMEYGRTSAVPNPLNMVANVFGSLGNVLNTPRE